MGADTALYESDFGFSPLFANQGFLSGMASLMDFWGLLPEYNRCNTGEQADFFATHYDWVKIGADIRAALIVIAAGCGSGERPRRARSGQRRGRGRRL